MMMKLGSGARPSIAALALAASLWAVGCTLENATAPSVTGPSEFGLSVTASAVPDLLPRDGSSQSVITLSVRDAQNRPVSGQRLTLSVNISAAALSAAEVTTDAAGHATFTVTAPPASALAGNVVRILATPVGSTSGGALPRTIEVTLSGAVNSTVPSPVISDPVPLSPEVGQVTTFNASASTDEGAACLDACTYTWVLGGEGSKTGRIITHAFQTPGVHSVTLTVTDAAGTSASAQRNVTVTAAARPTVSFTIVPAIPTAGQPATFTATVTVAANHRITRFDWNWGDASTNQTSNASINHVYASAGTYVVNVTVTDDLGQTATTTAGVTVSSGVTASFTFSPIVPQPGEAVQFNGSPSFSTGSATITEWTWDFGDGTLPVTETDASISHIFAAERTYRVRLTVKDSGARTGTTTQDVVVDIPDP